jgi:hypothetical protein
VTAYFVLFKERGSPISQKLKYFGFPYFYINR